MLDHLYRLVDPRNWEFQMWAEQVYTDQMLAQAEALPLRRDVVTLLTFVNEHKVVGTRSTGNMPLKLIRQLAPLFVVPPELDDRIGERIYPLKSEYDVWPLYFLHALAEVGGLVETLPGRLWRILPNGESFLETDCLDQTLHLLFTWWYQTNWLIAYPLAGLGEALPPAFEGITLRRLRAMPVGRRIRFEPFADQLIRRAGLTWSAPQSTVAQDLLRSGIRKMVIQVAADFGIVELAVKERAPGLVPRLVAFEVTAFGRLLLTALDLLGTA